MNDDNRIELTSLTSTELAGVAGGNHRPGHNAKLGLDQVWANPGAINYADGVTAQERAAAKRSGSYWNGTAWAKVADAGNVVAQARRVPDFVRRMF